MSNIIRQWNGRTIRQREQGYLSATDMCQACDKKVAYLNSFVRNQRIQIMFKHDLNGNFVIKDSESVWYKRPLAMALGCALNSELSYWIDEWLIWEPIEAADKTAELVEKIQDFFSSGQLKTTALVSEFSYRDHLRSVLGGISEVILGDGKYRIDLLTDDAVIEVKFLADWLKGLEQVNTYSTYYPTKKKVLALFGQSRRQDLSYIRSYCAALQVEVIYLHSDGTIASEYFT